MCVREYFSFFCENEKKTKWAAEKINERFPNLPQHAVFDFSVYIRKMQFFSQFFLCAAIWTWEKSFWLFPLDFGLKWMKKKFFLGWRNVLGWHEIVFGYEIIFLAKRGVIFEIRKRSRSGDCAGINDFLWFIMFL